jgi:hypothetical protein
MHLRAPLSFLEETHESITIGQEEGGRIASSQNQDFGTIFYSPVSKIQHNETEGPIGSMAIFGPVINGTVQLGEHVGIQIAASGFHQVRFCYAPCLSFPNAIVRKMLTCISIFVHRRVDVLYDPRLQKVERMIGHRCAP